MQMRRLKFCLVAAVLMCLLNLSASGSVSPNQGENKDPLKEKWGIQPKNLCLTAGGNMLDFRYQVIDSGKASSLFKAKEGTPILVDQATGAILRIPSMAKMGSLRTSMKNPVEGKTYFMLFANPGGLVKKGGKITLLIGDLKTENLVVD
jgi:hypothetical protein